MSRAASLKDQVVAAQMVRLKAKTAPQPFIYFRLENILKNKINPGFTLLEVMVAMAIMAITLMAVLDSQSASISRVSEAKFSTTAPFLAQKKMAEIEIMKTGDLASNSDDFENDYPGYSWELTVEDASFDAPENVTDHLKQIDLKISWGEDQLYSYRLRQYRFSPAQ